MRIATGTALCLISICTLARGEVPGVKVKAFTDTNVVQVNSLLVPDSEKIKAKLGKAIDFDPNTPNQLQQWWPELQEGMVEVKSQETKQDVELKWIISQEYRSKTNEHGELRFDHIGDIRVKLQDANPKNQIYYDVAVKKYGWEMEKRGDREVQYYTYVVAVGLNQPGTKWQPTMRKIADKMIAPAGEVENKGGVLESLSPTFTADAKLDGFKQQAGVGGFSFLWKIRAEGTAEYTRGQLRWATYGPKSSKPGKETPIDETAKGKWSDKKPELYVPPKREDKP